MSSWMEEPELVSIALSVLGEEGLDAWLREQYQLHDELHGLALTKSVWKDVDGGPLIDRLCFWLVGQSELPADRRPAQNIPFYRTCHRILFGGLLQHLPIEQLSEPLRDRRFALDLGH